MKSTVTSLASHIFHSDSCLSYGPLIGGDMVFFVVIGSKVRPPALVSPRRAGRRCFLLDFSCFVSTWNIFQGKTGIHTLYIIVIWTRNCDVRSYLLKLA